MSFSLKKVREESISGKGNNHCKGPEMGEGLDCSRNSEESSVAWLEQSEWWAL